MKKVVTNIYNGIRACRVIGVLSFFFFILACTKYADEDYSIDNDTSILALNPSSELVPLINNLRNASKVYGDGSYIKNLVLLHVSDFHEDQSNMVRLKEFYSYYSDYIDDVIHTGDLFGTDISVELPASFDKTWLNVIGNHDATIYTESGYMIQSSIQSYNKIFAPVINNWHVSQPLNAAVAGKCYYYKDYPEYKIRLIVLDDYKQGENVNNHWNREQKEWFQSTLDEVLDETKKEFGYHVVVATHYPAFLMAKQPDNPFDSLDFGPEQCGKCDDEIPTIIKEFKNKGGMFVCYISGHLHSDLFGVGIDGSGYENQLCVSVACASVPAAQRFCDMYRVKGNKSQDCFNLLGIDTISKTIKIIRIGADCDRYLRRKNTLCWDYENNLLVAVNR